MALKVQLKVEIAKSCMLSVLARYGE